MANKALLVGINAYPAPNELNGCINDIDDMTAYLTTQRGFQRKAIKRIIDAQATTAKVLAALDRFATSLKPGDRALFHYSGHGAQMPTRTAGEIDGLDEVICPVDFDWSDEHAIRDDDFNRIMSKVPAGVEFVWVSDSCHSASLERAELVKGQKAREIRPTGELAFEIRRARERGVPVRKLTAPSKLNVALISGCKSDQTSADAEIGGRYNGAATYFLLREIKAAPDRPLTELIPAVNKALRDAHYSQRPQLAGSKDVRGRAFLAELGAAPA
jgi:hypothetical protein